MNIKEIADYCLKCKNPSCIKGCPAHNDIPTIMNYVSLEQYHEAYRVLLKNQVLPEICGTLCAYDRQCEGHCVRSHKGEAVKIGAVEATLASMYKESFLEDYKVSYKLSSNIKVAIVGAGITGITASIILALAGASVTLYEKEKQIGGTVTKYIPDFRFASSRFSELKNILDDLFVYIKFGYELGKNLLLNDLEDYDFKIICTGADQPTNIWNEKYPSCYMGLDILRAFNSGVCDIKRRNVIVIGAGNVAMDVARSLKRLDNNVTIVYRRNMKNSPASIYEINEARNEGINIAEFWAPIKPIIKEEALIGLQVQKTMLDPNSTTRRQNVIPIEGALSNFPCDTIVVAAGAVADRHIFKDANIDTTSNRYLNYYFGGDFLTGPKTIVQAMAAGKQIAEEILARVRTIEEAKQKILASSKPIFFGGSFNPPTLAHYRILDFLNKEFDTEVLVVPNSDDYHYHNKELIDFTHRVNMLKIMTKNLKNVKIIETENNKEFKGSVETLKDFDHPWFVMGADSLAFISTWINAKKLVKQNNFIVFNRPGYNIEEIFEHDKLLSTYRSHFVVIDNEFGNISSSTFRKTQDKNMLTEEVYNYIIKEGLYEEE